MATPTNIQVDDYNPQWPIWFANLKEQIWPVVKDVALAFEHVGSTSVPGLAAKPIIDIDIVIESAEQLPLAIRGLQSLGYEHRGNMGIEGREAFKAPSQEIRHNLYVCIKDGIAVRNHINLREHLKKNPQARKDYEALKRRLASSENSIDTYVEGKTAFIVSILKQYEMNANELSIVTKSNQTSSKRLRVIIEQQLAELWDNNKLLKTYQVSTAINGLGCEEGSFCTPIGKLQVASKIGDGLPLGGVLRSRIFTGEIWSKDPSNPLANSVEDLILTRLLWLQGAEENNINTFQRFIYLHGTNQEELLGKPASHGCIRFSNSDILEVFEMLQTGSEVEIG